MGHTDMGAYQARPLLLTPGSSGAARGKSSLTGVGMSRCETYRHNNQPALLPFVQAKLCPPTHKAIFMWTLSSSPKGPWMLAHSFIYSFNTLPLSIPLGNSEQRGRAELTDEIQVLNSSQSSWHQSLQLNLLRYPLKNRVSPGMPIESPQSLPLWISW